MTIIRNPTAQEKDLTPIDNDGETAGFVPIGYKTLKKTAKQRFILDIKKQESEASKKMVDGYPGIFASQVAMLDFKEHYEAEGKKSLRKNGYVKEEDITIFKPEWERYSDMSNFELIEEGERSDPFLTKINPGLNVFAGKRKYRYKGTTYIYTTMEDGPSSIRRAREKLIELEELTRQKIKGAKK